MKNTFILLGILIAGSIPFTFIAQAQVRGTQTLRERCYAKGGMQCDIDCKGECLMSTMLTPIHGGARVQKLYCAPRGPAGCMVYVTQQTPEKIPLQSKNSITKMAPPCPNTKANGSQPTNNGNSAGGWAVTKSDFFNGNGCCSDSKDKRCTPATAC